MIVLLAADEPLWHDPALLVVLAALIGFAGSWLLTRWKDRQEQARVDKATQVEDARAKAADERSAEEVLRDLDRFVLRPHFMPDPVTGSFHDTQPARVERVEAVVAEVQQILAQVQAENTTTAAELKGTGDALKRHMADELRKDTDRDQADHEWREEVRRDIAQLEDRVNDVHTRFDETLAALAAGNPEIHLGTFGPSTPTK